MELFLVSYGFRPLCAFITKVRAEDFHPDRSAKTLKGEKIEMRVEKLVAVDGFRDGDRMADEGELTVDHGKVFVCFSRGNRVAVTRSLDHARNEAMGAGVSSHGDVIAVDLEYPEAAVPNGPRCQYVSDFGPYWPMTMHEKWRRHMRYFEEQRT